MHGILRLSIDLGEVLPRDMLLDELTILLEKESVTSAVINLGGNISTMIGKPDGMLIYHRIEKPWPH